MADFQNVGNFDAGVFTPKLGGVAPSGSSFTMDAAGIASGGAFLTSELEKRDPLIRKPLTSVTYARDIPIQTGGGWVDYVTAMNVAYGITGGSGSGAVGAGGANGTPIIQANVAKGAYKAHLFSAALRVNFVDMQRSNLIGRSLDQLLQDGIRLTYDKHMDANVYTGFEDYGTTGLMNSPNVTETTAASNGADSSSTKWKDKTPQQILKDVNDLLSAVWASCEYDTDAIPNHILLPYEQYNYILTTMVSDLASETIYDFLMKNNAAVKNGGELFIGGCRWCKGAGTGKTDRMVGYVNKPRYIKMDELVPMSRIMTAPNVTNVCYDTAYMAKHFRGAAVLPHLHSVRGRHLRKGEASCSSSQKRNIIIPSPAPGVAPVVLKKRMVLPPSPTGPRRRPILRHGGPMVRSLPPNTAIRHQAAAAKDR